MKSKIIYLSLFCLLISLSACGFKKVRDSNIDLFYANNIITNGDKKFGYYVKNEILLNSSRNSKNKNNMIIDISKTMAKKDVINAERNIDYIAQKINSYPQSVITKTLGSVLESNITKMVLAQSDSEYAFTVLDPPILPMKKFWPSRTFIVLSSFLTMSLIIIIAIFTELQYSLRAPNLTDNPNKEIIK